MRSSGLIPAVAVACLAVAALHPPSAQATLPMRHHNVIGCVVHGQFVPYAKQADSYKAGKLPYWVHRSGGSKLEGKEIRIVWHAFSGAIPNYVFKKNNARWELQGACDRSRLSALMPPGRP